MAARVAEGGNEQTRCNLLSRDDVLEIKQADPLFRAGRDLDRLQMKPLQRLEEAVVGG
jgi:hypothetical protein